MKLISLNTWGGAVFEPLIAFVKHHAPMTDIFCFQEVYTCTQSVLSNGTRMNIFDEIKAALPDFESFFAPVQDNMDEEGTIHISSTFGHAIFVRRPRRVEESGFVFTNRGRNTLEGNDFSTLGAGFQYILIRKDDDVPLTIASIHGIPEPGDKRDTPERIRQSEIIHDFLQAKNGAKIICGDFNLAPDTGSVKLLEKDMRNLIREFGITDTRGPLNAKKYPGQEIHKFADYAFVSPDVAVRSFSVPSVAISDHLPLILEFS